MSKTLPPLKEIDLLVFDFDGVFTDNKVYVSEDGTELVRCDRGDGWGISLLRKEKVPMMILSTEKNPVVAQRAIKLKLECVQGVGANKGEALKEILASKGVTKDKTVFVGNDINDIDCLDLAGTAVAVADSHPRVLELADVVLSRNGGEGAVRELAEMLLEI